MASKTLYVGNVPYSLTEASLSAAFAPYGGSNARIVEGRGFGFIDVADDQAGNAIEAMNGKSLDGRTLTVNEARPRGTGDSGGRDNSSSGGRSGSGGGGSLRGGRW